MKRIKEQISVWNLLVWAYRDQRVDENWFHGRERALGYGGVTPTGKVCRILELGCIVDGNGPGMMPYKVPADADSVHQVVIGLSEMTRDLLINCAIMAQAPQWRRDLPVARIDPVRRGNGKPKMVYVGRRNVPVACQMVITGFTDAERRYVDSQARQQYEQWVSAVRSVAMGLMTKELRRYRLQGLGIVARPWVVTERPVEKMGLTNGGNICTYEAQSQEA